MNNLIANSNDEVKEKLITDKNILLEQLKYYGSVEAREKGKRSCAFCDSGDALGVYEKEGKFNYKCFSCQEHGNVINLIRNKENITFIQALSSLAKQYNIEMPNNNNYIKANRVNTKLIAEFTEKKKKEALENGNTDKAYHMAMQELEADKSYYIQFKYLDKKNNPYKMWENLEIILQKEGIEVVYNVISKEIEILGLTNIGLNDQIMDIHSLCCKYGFKLNTDFIYKSIKRIARKNIYNPVLDYLRNCSMEYDPSQNGQIKKLCETLILKDGFPENLRLKLVTKWLLNTAYIAHNSEDSRLNVEGILVVQGGQGIGKTSWIKHIIPKEFLKTGLELNPQDTDSIRKCNKYWVCELGELDSTMKADQAKLKAFITESIDEYRIPYAVAPERYARTTSFYGTVNKSEFLKDETGDRRYWVIPVKDIDLKALKKIDIVQLWAEVMALLEQKVFNLYLDKEELKELNESNKEFRVKGATQIALETSFNWGTDKKYWQFITTEEIAKKLNLKSTTGIKEIIEGLGGEPIRRNIIIGSEKVKKRGYKLPTLKTDFILEENY